MRNSGSYTVRCEGKTTKNDREDLGPRLSSLTCSAVGNITLKSHNLGLCLGRTFNEKHQQWVWLGIAQILHLILPITNQHLTNLHRVSPQLLLLLQSQHCVSAWLDQTNKTISLSQYLCYLSNLQYYEITFQNRFNRVDQLLFIHVVYIIKVHTGHLWIKPIHTSHLLMMNRADLWPFMKYPRYTFCSSFMTARLNQIWSCLVQLQSLI